MNLCHRPSRTTERTFSSFLSENLNVTGPKAVTCKQAVTKETTAALSLSSLSPVSLVKSLTLHIRAIRVWGCQLSPVTPVTTFHVKPEWIDGSRVEPSNQWPAARKTLPANGFGSVKVPNFLVRDRGFDPQGLEPLSNRMGQHAQNFLVRGKIKENQTIKDINKISGNLKLRGF
jgi:hypothetical protein